MSNRYIIDILYVQYTVLKQIKGDVLHVTSYRASLRRGEVDMHGVLLLGWFSSQRNTWKLWMGSLKWNFWCFNPVKHENQEERKHKEHQLYNDRKLNMQLYHWRRDRWILFSQPRPTQSKQNWLQHVINVVWRSSEFLLPPPPHPTLHPTPYNHNWLQQVFYVASRASSKLV